MNEKTPIEKLTVLLPHWLEHNQEHINQMRVYLDALERQGDSETSRRFSAAVKRMDDVSDALRHVMDSLVVVSLRR